MGIRFPERVIDPFLAKPMSMELFDFLKKNWDAFEDATEESRWYESVGIIRGGKTAVWSLDDAFPYAYTISMFADQKIFTEACKLIEAAIPARRGTTNVDFLDGDMFCRYSLPNGLIHVRSDTQIDAVLVDSTIDLKPILKDAYPSMLVTRNGIDEIPDIQDAGTIDIEIDGFPCNECRSFHPTLTWHDKYNDYLLENALWIGKYREALQKYGLDQFAIEAQRQFDMRLEWKKLLIGDHADKCVICSSPTYFYDSRTKRYVCSDECHHKDVYEKE